MATYTCKGNVLRTGDTLAANEYLMSPNRLFYLMMQGNGDLCLFHGSGPDNHHDPILWYSHTSDAAQGGTAFLAMQGDGNLCLYRGAPGAQGGWIWGLNDGKNRLPFGEQNEGSVAIMQNDGNFVVYAPSGVMWGVDCPPAISSVVFQSISYDQQNMVTSDLVDPDQTPVELTNNNNSDIEQTQTLTFSKSYSKTDDWSESDSVSLGVSISMPLIPVLNEGSVSISETTSHTYTSGASTQSGFEIDASIPVSAKAGEKVTCTAVLRKRTFRIPYTANALFSYPDGAQVVGTVTGAYVGTSYFLATDISKPVPATLAGKELAAPLGR